MIGVVRAEIQKTYSSRSGMVMMLVAVGLPSLIAIASGIWGDYSGSDYVGPAMTTTPGKDIMQAGFFALFFALFIGVLSIGGEYRHGSIAPTLLVTPSRTKLLAAKVIALIIVAGILCAAAVIACGILGKLTLPIQGVKANLGKTAALDTVLAALAVGPLYACVGFGMASILRNQTGAIVVLLVWIFVLDSIVTALLPGYGPYALGACLSSAAGLDGGVDNPLSQAMGFLVSGGYVVVLLGLGWLVVDRSDVTG